MAPKKPTPTDSLALTNIGSDGPADAPDQRPSCPYIFVANCPYTAATAHGCPYKQMANDNAIIVPDYCPLIP